MTSAFSYVIKSLVLMIFSSSIIAIFFRLLTLALVFFFLLPLLFPGTISLLVRVQLFLLAALLCEFLSSKICNVIQGTNFYELKDKKPYAKLIGQSLSAVLSSKKLSFFVHTQSVAIEKLIPKSMYKEIASENQNTVKIFDHYEKPIVSMELNACRQALKSFVVYPELAQILKSIKKSKSESFTFVMSVQDLVSCFSQKDLLVQIHGFSFELGAFLGRRIHINLIIEDMRRITGFDTFLQLQNDINLMHFETIVSKKNTRDILEVFEESFTSFSDKIDAAIRGINFIVPTDAQNVITFAQQIQYLKESIQEVIASLVLISKDVSIFNYTLVNVHFLSSVSASADKSDVLPQELQSCLVGKLNG